MPIIKNAHSLSSTKSRKDALMILEAGIKAVNTKHIISTQIKRTDGHLQIGKVEKDLRAFKRIFIVGIGKAAFDATESMSSILGNLLTKGIVLDVKGGKIPKIKSIIGTHPLPSKKNMKATEEIIKLLKETKKDDLVIAIISGGGSALLCQPFDLECEEIIRLTHALLNSGATIDEINTVRKHVSDIQGGQLASIAAPAHVVALIFSDVPGGDISMIASGPTTLDETTIKDAKKILVKYDVLKKCGLPDCNLRETPKNPKLFEHVTNILLVSNAVATKAMKERAIDLGYKARIKTNNLKGEAKRASASLIKNTKPGEVLIAGGETTVTVRGDGRGGRNQELVLGALEHINKKTLILACASDGIDNTDVAGAIADLETIKKAKSQKLDSSKYLHENDAYTFFKKTKDQIKTGITGTNVSDLVVVIKNK